MNNEGNNFFNSNQGNNQPTNPVNPTNVTPSDNSYQQNNQTMNYTNQATNNYSQPYQNQVYTSQPQGNNFMDTLKNNKLIWIIAVVVIVIAVFLLSPLSTFGDVVCTKSSSETTGTLNQKITGHFQFGNLNTLDDIITFELSEQYLPYKSTFISALEKQYDSFKTKYGITPVVKEINNGASITFSMSKKDYEEEFGAQGYASKTDFIKVFEDEGYTCK